MSREQRAEEYSQPRAGTPGPGEILPLVLYQYLRSWAAFSANARVPLPLLSLGVSPKKAF